MILQSQKCLALTADGRGHLYGHPKRGCGKGATKRLALSQHLSNEVCALVALHDYDVDVTTASLRHMIALLEVSNWTALPAYDL